MKALKIIIGLLSFLALATGIVLIFSSIYEKIITWLAMPRAGTFTLGLGISLMFFGACLWITRSTMEVSEHDNDFEAILRIAAIACGVIGVGILSLSMLYKLA